MSEKADEKTVARERVGAAERKRRVERYQRVMGPSIDERLWVDRAKLVAVYLKNPSVFPNGPDSRAWGGEAWYKERPKPGVHNSAAASSSSTRGSLVPPKSQEPVSEGHSTTPSSGPE